MSVKCQIGSEATAKGSKRGARLSADAFITAATSSASATTATSTSTFANVAYLRAPATSTSANVAYLLAPAAQCKNATNFVLALNGLQLSTAD